MENALLLRMANKNKYQLIICKMCSKGRKCGIDCYLQNINKNRLINLTWEQIVSRFDKTKGKVKKNSFSCFIDLQ